VSAPRSIAILTRNNPDQTATGLRRLLERAAEARVEVRLSSEEIEKHGLDGVEPADPDGDTDLAVVLGGDGTILASLRRFAGRDVPTFAVNYGAIGFLATVESADLENGIDRALAGDFEVLALPALTFVTAGREQIAVNDVSFHRRAELRVAELGYSVSGEGLGEVRCDGLVVATAAGSTGYNLANGGPVMAWGVEGFVVSFIAPHTLTARGLVVAPDDVLEVTNRSGSEPVDVTTDGRTVCTLAPQQRVEIRFGRERALLAQRPGASFYHRMRDKFGRLAY
jgi:NAD+ kinase